MRLLLITLLLFILCTIGYGQLATTPGVVLPGCLQKADHLLDEAFSFMQKNYYRKSDIAWEKLVTTAKKKLNSSGNCNDVYEIISGCFRELNETHSFIMPPSRAAIYNNETTTVQQKLSLSQLVGDIDAASLGDSIGYISVPWVSTTDSTICKMVADSLQQVIAAFDRQGINGWIIDLRKNTGGNCWPMLAGLGPLLGDGICGYFVTAREKIAITYKDGAACQGKYVRCRVSGNGYKLKQNQVPIIILTGRNTVSSGEIVALAFKGKEQVHFYGEPTAGLTTANATYTLSDNSMLVLTVCREADRYGKICEGKIIPDETFTADNPPGNDDAAKTAAIGWLSAHLRQR